MPVVHNERQLVPDAAVGFYKTARYYGRVKAHCDYHTAR